MTSPMDYGCREVSELLPAYLDNEVDSTTALRMSHHLEKCPVCEARFESLGSFDRLFKLGLALDEEQRIELEQRATALNQGISAKISEEFAANPRPFPVVDTIPRRRWSLFQLSVAASLFFILGTTLMFTVFSPGEPGETLSERSFPVRPELLRKAALMHEVCAKFADPGPDNSGIAVGEQRARALAMENGIAFPKISDPSLTLVSLHFCRLGTGRVGHFYFRHGTQLVSFYYGGQTVLGELCRECPDFPKQRQLSFREKDLTMAAFSAPSQSGVWFIVGDLKPEVLDQISLDLTSTTA